jgi:hypothetical protein
MLYNRGHESSLAIDLGKEKRPRKKVMVKTEKSKQMTSLKRKSSYNEATGKEAKHKYISVRFEVLAAVVMKMFSTMWRHVVC